MIVLFLAIALSLVISATCSLTETVLYSVSWAHIEKLRLENKPSGQILFDMRERIDKPIAAVLTLNTVANTAGSAIAGAAFMAVLGAEYMGVFAAGFTILILVFGEIIPKTLGVTYANPISSVLARPLYIVSKLLSPIVWLSSHLTQLISSKGTETKISEDDIRAITSLSRKAGSIEAYEERSIRNILSLDQKRVWDIMTPRTVVFSLPANLSLKEAYTHKNIWHFSRIPVYAQNNEDLVGMIERRTLGKEMYKVNDGTLNPETKLSDIMRPIHFVQESKSLDQLLQEFLSSRTHLFVVLDEYGGLAGVVSLEDVLEEILGHEILDESDAVANLRELALQRFQKAKKS